MSPRRRAVRSVGPVRRVQGEINVTPLVDVVLVLLIIFMVLTPLREEALRVRVPDAEEPPERALDAPAQLVVGVGPEGALALNGVPVPDLACEGRLEAALRARRAGDRVVFFAAADAAPYHRLVFALDLSRRAGAEVLAFTTEPMAPSR